MSRKDLLIVYENIKKWIPSYNRYMIMGFGVILRLKTNVPVRNMNVFPELGSIFYNKIMRSRVLSRDNLRECTRGSYCALKSKTNNLIVLA